MYVQGLSPAAGLRSSTLCNSSPWAVALQQRGLELCSVHMDLCSSSCTTCTPENALLLVQVLGHGCHSVHTAGGDASAARQHAGVVGEETGGEAAEGGGIVAEPVPGSARYAACASCCVQSR